MPKISELADGGALLQNDQIPVVRSGSTVRANLGSPALVSIRPQIVTTRGTLLNARRQGTENSRDDVRIEVRNKYFTGRQAISQLQLANPGFLMNPVGEQSLGNAYTWEAAIELTSPACDLGFFSLGSNLAVVPNGSPYVLTDTPVGFDIAAGSNFWLRQAFSVANDTMYLPVGTGGTATGDSGYLSNSVVSQIPGHAALSNPSGGASYSAQCPAVVLGIPAAPMASVIYVGDSIADGSGDSSDGNGNLGFVARGLWDVDGYPVPWAKQTIGSWSFSKATIDTSPRMRSYWPFCTHLIIALGTNDIAGNSSNLAAMQAFVTNMCTAAKRVIGPYGIPIKTAVCTIVPRTTSSNNFADAAGQTPQANMGVGEASDLYNQWLPGQEDNGIIDKVIDTNAKVEDPSHPRKWLTNGSNNYLTGDGTHPNPAGHALMKDAVNEWALDITPY